MFVRFNGTVYLFGFKLVEADAEGRAMEQLKRKRYADKYRGICQPVHLVAVEFSKKTRNLVTLEAECASFRTSLP